MKLRFDGHGVNFQGKRIANISQNFELTEENKRDPDLDMFGNLFASAPEMLEALEWSLTELVELYDGDGCDCITCQMYRKITHVICKAKGE